MFRPPPPSRWARSNREKRRLYPHLVLVRLSNEMPALGACDRPGRCIWPVCGGTCSITSRDLTYRIPSRAAAHHRPAPAVSLNQASPRASAV
jgi:hypothetical protein